MRSRLRPAVFFDRDGVLNEDSGYVSGPHNLKWIKGAREAIKLANDTGCFAFVVTNQSGVARGYYTERDVKAFHERMAADLARFGARIDAFEYCPYHPEATIDRYRQISHRRKPESGMIDDLLRRFHVDINRSVLIGDKPTDLQAARAAGIKGFLYKDEHLAEFLKSILRSQGISKRTY